MATSIDILRVRRVLGTRDWLPPTRFGPDGWKLVRRSGRCSVLVTCSPHPDPEVKGEFLHASIAYSDHMPTYYDLALLHKAVWGDGYAYQVFVGGNKHVNIHHHALHLWGRPDGSPMLPEFAQDFGRGMQI